jgi:UDP-N-acetylmuramyl pentapeptide phosphotransferase/UDP-N-acetylglucosamine-1-phosphate transferase
MLSYKEAPKGDPARSFGALNVPATKVGAIVSIGLVVICWFALPDARFFIVGTAFFGALLGFILYWKHRGLSK